VKKNSTTISEIFIVLTLVFFVQTVVNFGLLTQGTPLLEPSEVVEVRLEQIPARGSAADHIQYLRAGDLIYLPDSDGCGAISPAAEVYELSQYGCRSATRQDSREYVEGASGLAGFDGFAAELRNRYEVGLNRHATVGLQPMYSLLAVRDSIRQSVELEVGLCVCYLDDVELPENASRDDIHPLLVSTLRFGGDKTEHRTDRFRFNQSHLSPVDGSLIPITGALSGLLFTDPGCSIPCPPGDCDPRQRVVTRVQIRIGTDSSVTAQQRGSH
jgi:hypothetical protein